MIVAIICFFAVVWHYSKVLSPGQIKDTIKGSISAIFPSSITQLKDVKYKPGVITNIYVEELVIRDKKTNDVIFESPELKISIPVNIIMLGSGAITISSDDSTINASIENSKLNWRNLFGGVKGKSVLAVPKLIGSGKSNLKLTNVNFTLENKDKNTVKKIKIKQIFLKDLSFKGKSAIEVIHRDNYDFYSKKIAYESLFIGEFSLANFIGSNIFSIDCEWKLSKLSILPDRRTLPSIKTNMELEINKTGGSKGSVKSQIGNNLIRWSYFSLDDNLEIKSLNAKFANQDLLDYFGIKNFPLQVGQSSSTLSGSMKIIGEKDVIPKLNFRSTPIETVLHSEKMTTELDGSYNGNEINFQKSFSLMKGNIVFKYLGEFPMLRYFYPEKFSNKDLNPFNVEVKANKLDIEKDFLTPFLEISRYRIRAPRSFSVDESQVDEKSGIASILKEFTYNYSFSAENIKIDTLPVEALGEFVSTKNTFDTKKLVFNLGFGQVELVNSMIKRNQINYNKFNLKLKGFNFGDISYLLPKRIEGLSGFFTGDLNGTLNHHDDDIVYEVNAKLEAIDGKFPALSMDENLERLKGKISPIKIHLQENNIITGSSFTKLNVEGKFSNAISKFDKLFYENELASIKGKGEISHFDTKTKDEFFFNLIDKKFKTQKSIGRKSIPLRLYERDGEMRFEYRFTRGKVLAVNKKKKIDPAVERRLRKEKQLKNKDVKKKVNDILEEEI